jgi:hypothetical protein
MRRQHLAQARAGRRFIIHNQYAHHVEVRAAPAAAPRRGIFNRTIVPSAWFSQDIPAESPRPENGGVTGNPRTLEKEVMEQPSQTDGTDSPANLAVNTQIPSPETQRPAKPDLSSVVPGLHTTLQRAYPFILIVSVAWLANFLHFTSFGHYEDDWYCFPAAFGQPLFARIKVLLSMIKSLFQGRPVPLVHETVFSYVGKLFSSISLPYVLAFLMLSATALLFYRVPRVRFPRLFCTLASVLFVQSPLTTVR